MHVLLRQGSSRLPRIRHGRKQNKSTGHLATNWSGCHEDRELEREGFLHRIAPYRYRLAKRKRFGCHRGTTGGLRLAWAPSKSIWYSHAFRCYKPKSQSYLNSLQSRRLSSHLGKTEDWCLAMLRQ